MILFNANETTKYRKLKCNLYCAVCKTLTVTEKQIYSMNRSFDSLNTHRFQFMMLHPLLNWRKSRQGWSSKRL